MDHAAIFTRNSSAVRKLTYSALCLTLAMVLPFLTGQVPEIGSMLCPMHIPALLCGFLCGWPWGLAVGFLSPLLRSMFGMPPIWVAIPMAFEMATYGAVSGWLYRKLNGRGGRIYLSLITAMLAGRLVWGLYSSCSRVFAAPRSASQCSSPVRSRRPSPVSFCSSFSFPSSLW